MLANLSLTEFKTVWPWVLVKSLELEFELELAMQGKILG